MIEAKQKIETICPSCNALMEIEPGMSFAVGFEVVRCANQFCKEYLKKYRIVNVPMVRLEAIDS
jgi:hypothetical protein